MLGLIRHRAGGYAGVAATVGQGGSGDVEHGAIRGDGEGVSTGQRVAAFQPGDLRLGVACAGWKAGFGLHAKFFHACAQPDWGRHAGAFLGSREISLNPKLS